jgi:crossover junction endodeoxyribonuclease RuvC
VRVLAIDPGTACGWALGHLGRVVSSGTWNLKPKRFEGGGMRYVHLQNFLRVIGRCDLVVLEEVRRHMGVDAAHVYGGILATVQAWCETQDPPTPYTAIPVGTIKKRATGKGNAKKDAMVAAAREQWPGQDVKDDNQADALWLLECAKDVAP